MKNIYKYFWQKLPARFIFDLIRNAPMVASKWKAVGACDCGCGGRAPINHWRRYVYYGGDTILCASVKPYEDNGSLFKSTTWRGEFVESFGPFDTFNAAKEAADKRLQEAGWILLDNAE